MFSSILRAVGLSPKEDRREFERYAVTTPLEVTVDGVAHKCIVENVSVGGLRLEPPVDAAPGSELTILHPASGLHLKGKLIGNDENGARVSFDSAEAGAVISVWVRMMHEQESTPAHAV
ncbi:PilZ domain-containing protein [Nisaea acidiphila]|uniref:PilZ domain-containing protein n=1 Tax=Nisaea acidiphila TaxID=1862145 RepID=A0A9J7AQH6_9PROT|nr:PilZ domain-containing protein [Nisaea acidiphila]UUX49414.1 PilZ domain-containing protein [Nisaea acidiphila]